MTIDSWAVWEPRELMQLIRDPRFDAVPSFFLDTFFPGSYNSEDNKIRFGKLPRALKKMAPFVLPTQQGKPIFERQNESVDEFIPPYLKPKDVVRALDATNVLPSEWFRAGDQRPSLQQRFDMRVTDVMAAHVRSVRMTESWMAARAIIDGGVTCSYKQDDGTAGETVYLDFNRDPGHTVIKTANYWDNVATDILTDVQDWRDTMYSTIYGGYPNMMIVGSAVARVFRTNTTIKDILDIRYRGGDSVSFSRGLVNSSWGLNYLGTLDTGLDVYTYREQVQNADGSYVEVFDPRDVLMVANGPGYGVEGVKCYGAILNDFAVGSGLSNAGMFPSMWRDNDPSGTYLMLESAPLPVPIYPNRTFKARVLA